MVAELLVILASFGGAPAPPPPPPMLDDARVPAGAFADRVDVEIVDPFLVGEASGGEGPLPPPPPGADWQWGACETITAGAFTITTCSDVPA